MTYDSAIDLVKVWGGVLRDLVAKQGAYSTLYAGKVQVPKLTLTQIRELQTAWLGIYDRMFVDAKSREESFSLLQEAQYQYLADMAAWTDRYASQDPILKASWPETDGGKYVMWPLVDDFVRYTSQFVTRLTSVAHENKYTQPDFDRWASALPPGVRQVFQMGGALAKSGAVNDVANALKTSVGILGFLLKWGPYLAVGGAAVYVTVKVMKRRE